MGKRSFGWVMVFALTMTACGSGAGDTDDSGNSTETSDTASDAAAPVEPDTTGAPVTTGGPQGDSGGSDGSGIDWASVDLNTVDWASIDLGTVDWLAIQQNSTAASLGADVQELIASRLDPGASTVVIGDTTYEFDNFLCAFGAEATESDTYSFSASSSGPFEDTNVQLSLDIRDDSGAGRLDGSGLVPGLEINDLGDFENPAVQWFATDGEITIDGYDLTFEGLFDDLLTPSEIEAIPVTFTGSCGDQSRDRR